MRRASRLLAVLVLLSAGIAFGQTGTITGTVSDVAGSVIPLAKVSVQNDATGATRGTVTNSTGTYSLPTLIPGTYTVTVTATGFAPAQYKGVTVTVGQTLPLDIRLVLGTVTQSVNVAVSTDAPVETESAQLSNIVDNKTIQSLPLITRDPYSLVLLSPGTVSATSSLGGFSVNGARERNNNFLLDGVDNNDTSVPGIPSGISSTNPDAVSEYRVITNNFEAQYGRNTGAIINVITMGGTNKFHGDAYWFGRYHALGARDWFNRKVDLTGTEQKQNPYVRNIFGASIGGPIYRDRSFFFFNFDLQRFRTTTTTSTTVPTATFKSGVFTVTGEDDKQHTVQVPVNLTNPNAPGNINGYTLDAKMSKILALFPTPNAGDSIPGISGVYSFPSSSRADQNVYTVRGDHKLREGQNLMVRYVYNKFTDPNPGFSDLIPGIGSYRTAQTAHNGTIQLNSVFGNHVTNQFAAAYNLSESGFFCNGAKTFDAITGVDSFGNGADYTFPNLFVTGCYPLGESNGQDRLTGTMMFFDSLAVVRGNHTMRFGGEYRVVRIDGYNDFSTRTDYTFNVFSNGGGPAYDLGNISDATATYTAVQDMIYALAGVVQNETVTQNFDKNGNPIPSDNRRYRQHEYAIYAQDSWKILPRLNLSLGLRYEFYGVPFETANNLTQLFTPANTTASSVTFVPVGPGTGKQLYPNSSNLFQPRAGFSYDLLGNGKIAIRGGAGIFSDRIYGNLFGNSRSNPPFQQSAGNIVNGSATLATVGFIPQGSTSATLTTDTLAQGITLIDPNLKQQGSYNWNLGFQAEILPDLVLESNYVGAHGLHILRVVDGNAPDPAITAQNVAYCKVPGNAYHCVNTPTRSTITGLNAWFGNSFGALPYNAAHNTIFYEPGLNRSIASSSYNAWETIVTKRFSHGFNLRSAYTWAHSLDDSGDPIVPGGQQRSFPRNSNALWLEHGNSDADVKHRVVIDGTYELPIGFGKANLSHGAIGKILQGISLSGIATVQSGQPVDLFGNRDSLHQGLSERLNLTGKPYPSGQGSSFVSQGKRTGPARSAFSLAPFDTVPTVGRNTFRGPNYTNLDAVFQKDTSFEAFHVLFRVESYNALNHPQFALPQGAFATPSTFGVSTATVGRSDGTTSARQIQAAMKVVF